MPEPKERHAVRYAVDAGFFRMDTQPEPLKIVRDILFQAVERLLV